MANKLDGINPGDRVRVTFEGELHESDGDDDIAILMDGGDIESTFLSREIAAPTFHIEKLAKPLKVGDVVKAKVEEWGSAPVITTFKHDEKDFIVVCFNGCDVLALPADQYERA